MVLAIVPEVEYQAQFPVGGRSPGPLVAWQRTILPRGGWVNLIHTAVLEAKPAFRAGFPHQWTEGKSCPTPISCI